MKAVRPITGHELEGPFEKVLYFILAPEFVVANFDYEVKGSAAPALIFNCRLAPTVNKPVGGKDICSQLQQIKDAIGNMAGALYELG